MSITDIIELIGISITFVIGAISIFISLKSNKISKEAIKMSKEANDISASSLKLNEEIKKENDENVRIESSTNIEIKYSGEVKFTDKICYDDLIIIIPVEIRNMSTNPVTLKRPTMCWGNDGEYNYLSEDDFYKVLDLNENDDFPMYMKPKEIRNINIVLGFDDSDRQKFYSEKGLTLCFQGTKRDYKKYFKSSNAIDNVRVKK